MYKRYVWFVKCTSYNTELVFQKSSEVFRKHIRDLRLWRFFLLMPSSDIWSEPCPGHVSLWNPLKAELPGEVNERSVVKRNKAVSNVSFGQQFPGQIADKDVKVSLFPKLG